ncbi:class I SAM-dependent methyltransferase [Asanoa sp. WMMD1127]|uniref:O-methyltransferase n=1 Tax=Asanoa sp. WMMD1127 TaxID=3016107 RepID=UPI002415AE5D|nr:class I SAM-dependent methyltransferase [Asanoa sp. WMMD1127]MDG4827395.1 class I SAM-dependent methyltransferase [Asanoa sp. WMMD1127]
MDTLIAPSLVDYVTAHSTPPDEVLRDLADATRLAAGDAARMQVSADQGALLTLLTRLTGARRAVEVGVFTGYSTLCIARGLAPGGRLLACDVSAEWTAVGQPFWARAGVAERIDLRLAPALATLRALPHDADLDFAFVDAHKPEYPDYYAEIVPRLRPGGLIVLDNMFLGGRVLEADRTDAQTTAVRTLNATIAADDRVDAVLLPVRDGVTVARRR